MNKERNKELKELYLKAIRVYREGYENALLGEMYDDGVDDCLVEFTRYERLYHVTALASLDFIEAYCKREDTYADNIPEVVLVPLYWDFVHPDMDTFEELKPLADHLVERFTN